LDNSPKGFKRHYLVMDFINGKNLSEMGTKNSKSLEIKDETDFLRMALLLLRELKVFHESGHFHCDIRPENIVSFQQSMFSFYMLIDYGSCFKKGEEDKRIATESKGFTPKDKIWDEKSDIYSLG
jgi:serine/threonine protein kinase